MVFALALLLNIVHTAGVVRPDARPLALVVLVCPMARHRWLTRLVVLVCRILSLGTIEAVTSEDNRIEVMRIPKTGSSSLGSHLMK